MFQVTRRVLFGDCDPACAVYTPRIAHYAVEACLDFQSDILSSPAPRSMFALGILPPARNLNIEFLSPLDYDDEITIKVSVLSIGRTSFTCLVEATKQGGQAAFKATLTQVCVDPLTRQPASIPEALVNALRPHLCSSQPTSNI